MTEVERPLDSDSYQNSPVGVGNQFFEPASMETFRSSHERRPRYSKDALEARLARENRRQQKDQERAELLDEAKARLSDELHQQEHLQAQLHAARDSIARRRAYADKAEKEIETLTKSINEEAAREEELAAELAKLQVEFDAYQAKMEGVEQELQRARDMTDEITTDRNKARDEARQAREERRLEAEKKRLDAARREGMMQGKLEGMYTGWEEGKTLGYKEGRRDGAHEQHDEMVNKKWRAIKRELPNYNLENRIPSPDSSFDGEVPDKLKALAAPIIQPPPPAPAPKKVRTPAAPPPATVYYDEEDDYIRPKPFHSSPEQLHPELVPGSIRPHHVAAPPPPPPVPSNLYGNTLVTHIPTFNPATQAVPFNPAVTTTQAPSSSRSAQYSQQQHTRPRTNVPPPAPVFGDDHDEWLPQVGRPDGLQRSKTWQKIEKRFNREPQEISHAPHHMDFAPIAAPLPYPTVATPLPQAQTLQLGRAVPTPAPSIFREPLQSEESSVDERRGRRRGREQEEQPQPSKGTVFTRLTSLVRSNRNQQSSQQPSQQTTPDYMRDPRTHQDVRSTPDYMRDPRTHQDVQSTPELPGRNSIRSRTPDERGRNSIMIVSPTASPSPSLRQRNLSQPGTPVWPPPSPRHPRLSGLPDNYIPPLDGDGGISLPPPHELHGSAMQSAINISSQNPSRNPSPSPSNRSLPRGRSRSRDPSPTKQRLSQIGHNLKDVASSAISRIPSRSKVADQFRGRSRSRSPITPVTPDMPDPVQQLRNISRSRSRPRSAYDDPYMAVPPGGLLNPEDIMVGPTVSDPSLDTALQRGRAPNRKGTAASQVSGRSSPLSQMSILSMGGGGALGLSRGERERERERERRDHNFVTYPNASTANLSMIEEEMRHSNYGASPSPNFRHAAEHALPPQVPPGQQFPQRPPAGGRHHSEGSVTMADFGDLRDPYDLSSRYPPPAPSMRSVASGTGPPPPIKSPQTSNNPYPWPNRPIPSKLQMPALLSAAQSPTPSSRGGFAGIGAGGGYHKRAASASALGLPIPPDTRSFASPHPSARLSMAGSYAGSESGRPPIAPKPQPPSRRNRSGPIVLDDPLLDLTPNQPGRSWSGEQQQIGHNLPTRSRTNSNAQPLVTVEERSPYLQGPEANRSTGSIRSVHSNRLNFNPKEYQDPSFMIQSDLTAALEREVGAPAPPSDSDAQPKKVTAKVGKRISKVLKFGSKK